MTSPRRRAAELFFPCCAIVVACGGVERGGTDVTRAHDDASTRGGTGGVLEMPGSGGSASGSGGSTSASGGVPACAGVRCSAPACHADQEPVTVPGDCCATLCRPRGVGGTSADAGTPVGSGGAPVVHDAGPPPTLACAPGPLPNCGGNQPPYCAPDWQTAQTYYPSCPDPTVWPPYLARCGSLNAIVVPGAYASHTFYFGRTGHLIGYLSESNGDTHCTAYEGSFSAPLLPCVPLDPACADAATTPEPVGLGGLDAGEFVSWDGSVPSCSVGQAAYDAYLASQLAQYNLCSDNSQCAGFMIGPTNACAQPCDLMLSVGAINSQIIARLDKFGNVACALCDPAPSCPPQFPIGRCVNGTCVPGP